VLRRVRTGHDRRGCACNATLVLCGDSWRFATLPSRCPSTGRSPSDINAPIVDEILARKGNVICRPWLARNGNHFSKNAFDINMRDRTITCPAGEQQHFTLGATVEFPADTCRTCPLRAKCTDARPERGRTVAIADNELLQHRLRKRAATSAGRDQLRERVPVEHRQAHTCRRQGRRARYVGARKNQFDLRRASAISNLEAIQHRLETPVKLAIAA